MLTHSPFTTDLSNLKSKELDGQLGWFVLVQVTKGAKVYNGVQKNSCFHFFLYFPFIRSEQHQYNTHWLRYRIVGEYHTERPQIAPY